MNLTAWKREKMGFSLEAEAENVMEDSTQGTSLSHNTSKRSRSEAHVESAHVSSTSIGGPSAKRTPMLVGTTSQKGSLHAASMKASVQK
eukprot:c40710_g1_i1 orf=167-433(+)